MSTINARLASGETLSLTAATYNEFKAALTGRFQAGRRSVSSLAFNYADYNAAQKAILTGLIHKSWPHICHVFGNSTSETNARIQRAEDFTENSHLMREWAGRFPGLSVADGSVVFAIGLTDCPSVLAATIRLLHLTDWPAKWSMSFQSNTMFKWATFDAISKGQRGLESARPYVAESQPVIVPPRSIAPLTPPSQAIQMPALSALPVVATATDEVAEPESSRMPRRLRCALCRELPSIELAVGGASLGCASPTCRARHARVTRPSQREAILEWNNIQRGIGGEQQEEQAQAILARLNSLVENGPISDITVDLGNGQSVSLTGSAMPDGPMHVYGDDGLDEGTPVLSNDEEEV